MTWEHHPDSPWGDIDICEHGCTKFHGKTDRVYCVYCDLDGNFDVQIKPCKCCDGGYTWHIENRCLRCSPVYNNLDHKCLKSKEICV